MPCAPACVMADCPPSHRVGGRLLGIEQRIDIVQLQERAVVLGPHFCRCPECRACIACRLGALNALVGPRRTRRSATLGLIVHGCLGGRLGRSLLRRVTLCFTQLGTLLAPLPLPPSPPETPLPQALVHQYIGSTTAIGGIRACLRVYIPCAGAPRRVPPSNSPGWAPLQHVQRSIALFRPRPRLSMRNMVGCHHGTRHARVSPAEAISAQAALTCALPHPWRASWRHKAGEH